MNTDDFSYIVKENERLRNIIASYDSPGALGEVFAVIASWIEQWERRVEDAELRAEEAESTLRIINGEQIPWETNTQMLQRVKIDCKGTE